jgi:purine-nucleoside phosphorylase
MVRKSDKWALDLEMLLSRTMPIMGRRKNFEVKFEMNNWSASLDKSRIILVYSRCYGENTFGVMSSGFSIISSQIRSISWASSVSSILSNDAYLHPIEYLFD